MARNMNCDGQNRKFLTDLVLDTVFDANFNAKYVQLKLKKRKESTTNTNTIGNQSFNKSRKVTMLQRGRFQITLQKINFGCLVFLMDL